MPIKSVKMKISKNKKMRFFLMSQGSLYSIPSSKTVVSSSRTEKQTDTQTDRQTGKWLLWAPFQGFRIFSYNLSSRSVQLSNTLFISDNFSIVNVLIVPVAVPWSCEYSSHGNLSFHESWNVCVLKVLSFDKFWSGIFCLFFIYTIQHILLPLRKIYKQVGWSTR